MTLFELFGKIAIKNEEANKNIDETTNKAANSQGKITKAFSAIGQGTLVAGKFVGGAAVAIGTALVAVTENTREYRTEMGKLETAYTTAGHSSEAAKQTYMELNAVLGDSGQAVEAANHLAKLCENEQQLQTWTTICTGVYATFGASLPIEGLTEAANETAKTGALTGGLADALNWAGVNEDAFQASLDACSSEQERQALITETLNGLYADAAVQYQETNAEVMEAQRAQDRLNDAMAKVGAACEPIMSGIKNAIATMAEAAVPAITGIIDVCGGFISKVTSAADTVASTASSIIGKFEEIRSGISEKINSAKETVGSAIEKIKGFFNFSWELPKLKLPHFRISGSFSLNPPSVPSFGIEWYKEGGILTDPTIFGINPGNGKAMVGGEAGAEAVAPLYKLEEYYKKWSGDGNKEMISLLKDIRNYLSDENKWYNIFLRALKDGNFAIVLDGREVGRMVRKYA